MSADTVYKTISLHFCEIGIEVYLRVFREKFAFPHANDVTYWKVETPRTQFHIRTQHHFILH